MIKIIAVIFLTLPFSAAYAGCEVPCDSWSTKELLFKIIPSMGVGIALFTYYRSIKNNIEAHARGLYRDYLQLAFANPDLANPEMLGFDPAAPISGNDKKRFEQYEWFVTYMLDAFDEIYQRFASHNDWTLMMRKHLAYHSAYLKGPFVKDEYIGQYSSSFQTFFKEQMKKLG